MNHLTCFFLIYCLICNVSRKGNSFLKFLFGYLSLTHAWVSFYPPCFWSIWALIVYFVNNAIKGLSKLFELLISSSYEMYDMIWNGLCDNITLYIILCPILLIIRSKIRCLLNQIQNSLLIFGKKKNIMKVKT